MLVDKLSSIGAFQCRVTYLWVGTVYDAKLVVSHDLPDGRESRPVPVVVVLSVVEQVITMYHVIHLVPGHKVEVDSFLFPRIYWTVSLCNWAYVKTF